MIICSCTVMSHQDLERAIDQIYERDPYAVITPGRVYHELGLRIVCHGCRPVISDEILRHVRHHQATDEPLHNQDRRHENEG